MRFLFGSMVIAMVGAMAAPPALASMVYPEPSHAARSDSFSLKFGVGFGAVIFDGYRTIDGKSFYLDESSSRSNNGTSASGIFGAVGDSNNDERSAVSSNAFGTASSNSGNIGSGRGFGGGKESFSLGFDGGKESFSAGGGSSLGGGSLKGLNPLNFAYANLVAGSGGVEGLGDVVGSFGNVEASATPLPPTWTMMLIGLGCFGLITRRLRKNETVFSAVWRGGVGESCSWTAN